MMWLWNIYIYTYRWIYTEIIPVGINNFGAPHFTPLSCTASSLARKNVLGLRKVRLQQNNLTTKDCWPPNWMVEGNSRWSKYIKTDPGLVRVDLLGFNGILHLFDSIHQSDARRCACWYCCGVDAACGAALVIAVAVGCLRCLKHQMTCERELGRTTIFLVYIYIYICFCSNPMLEFTGCSTSTHLIFIFFAATN